MLNCTCLELGYIWRQEAHSWLIWNYLFFWWNIVFVFDMMSKLMLVIQIWRHINSNVFVWIFFNWYLWLCHTMVTWAEIVFSEKYEVIGENNYEEQEWSTSKICKQHSTKYWVLSLGKSLLSKGITESNDFSKFDIA